MKAAKLQVLETTYKKEKEICCLAYRKRFALMLLLMSPWNKTIHFLLYKAFTHTNGAEHNHTKFSRQRQRDTKLVASATLIYTVLTFSRSYRVIIHMVDCSLAEAAQKALL